MSHIRAVSLTQSLCHCEAYWCMCVGGWVKLKAIFVYLSIWIHLYARTSYKFGFDNRFKADFCVTGERQVFFSLFRCEFHGYSVNFTSLSWCCVCTTSIMNLSTTKRVSSDWLLIRRSSTSNWATRKPTEKILSHRQRIFFSLWDNKRNSCENFPFGPIKRVIKQIQLSIWKRWAI